MVFTVMESIFTLIYFFPTVKAYLQALDNSEAQVNLKPPNKQKLFIHSFKYSFFFFFTKEICIIK